MKKLFLSGFLTWVVLAPAQTPAPKGVVFPLPNGGFEEGLAGWELEGDNGMTTVDPEARQGGKQGVRIKDDSVKGGSSLSSPRYPAVAGREYRARFWTRFVSGENGIAIYFKWFDGEGRELPQPSPDTASLTSSAKWAMQEARAIAPEGTKEWRVWFHSYNKAVLVQDIDDVVLYESATLPTDRPWAPLYKIKADEKNRLTAADLLGPDGIAYPDFRFAGVPGGIPDVAVTLNLAGKIKPGDDISSVLETEANRPGRKGAILIPPGNFRLSSAVLITNHGVVIRGSGSNQTRLVFDYQVPEGQVLFHRIKAGDRFNTLEIHARPTNLRRLSVEVDGKEVGVREYQAHWGNTFSHRVKRSQVLAKSGPGRHTLTGKATYADGRVVASSMELVVAAEDMDPPTVLPGMWGAISFAGGIHSNRVGLARDGRRGDLEITLSNASSFAAGDRIEVEAPATPRWRAITTSVNGGNACRKNQYEVVAVKGNAVRLSQPLRLEFPAVDGSYAVKITPVLGGGVEDLTLEQTESLWINSITFSRTWGCWAKRVVNRMAGKHPAYFLDSKFGEVRDSLFDDAWFKGGGGTAYGGVETSYDCLFDGVVTRELRHAPDFNWACSGNVVRNSIFYNSDAQWHSGWCNENLFENLTVIADGKDGDYGIGMFSTAPEDAAHGPIGPRNVIYNCDFRSPRDGGVLNGMNEGWLILHNRFTTEKGMGLLLRFSSFDHIISNNVFVLGGTNDQAILLRDASCVGVEITGNRAVGAKKFIGGMGKPLVDSGNVLVEGAESLPRPVPAVPSIYEWQRKTYPTGKP